MSHPRHAVKQGHAAQRLGAALAIIAALFTAGFIGHFVNPVHTVNLAPTVTITPTPIPTHPTPTRPSPTPPAEKTPHTTHQYTVKPGDTLWSIAAQHLHNPLAWHTLWQDNIKTIGGNPNVLYPGQVLQIELPQTSHGHGTG